MSQDVRCAGCGKVIEIGAVSIRIEIGRETQRHSFGSKQEWGRMHHDCFSRSVASPELALAQIRTQAKTLKKQTHAEP